MTFFHAIDYITDLKRGFEIEVIPTSRVSKARYASFPALTYCILCFYYASLQISPDSQALVSVALYIVFFFLGCRKERQESFVCVVLKAEESFLAQKQHEATNPSFVLPLKFE